MRGITITGLHSRTTLLTSKIQPNDHNSPFYPVGIKKKKPCIARLLSTVESTDGKSNYLIKDLEVLSGLNCRLQN